MQRKNLFQGFSQIYAPQYALTVLTNNNTELQKNLQISKNINALFKALYIANKMNK